MNHATYAAAAIRWVEQPPLPQARSGSATGLVGGHLVMAGGAYWAGDQKVHLDAVDAFDTAAGVWKSAARLPAPLAYGAACVDARGLLVIGGTDGERIRHECWHLRELTHWEPAGVFPEDCLVLARAVALGDLVLAVAGATGPNDLRQGSPALFARAGGARWEKISAVPHGPSCLAAVATVGGCLYVFGGCYAGAANQVVNRDNATRFDPRDGRWTTLRSLPDAVRGASAVAVDDRLILLFGGYTTRFESSVWVYEIDQDRYTPATPLPLAVMGMEFVIAQHTLYGAGGEIHGAQRSARTFAGCWE